MDPLKVLIFCGLVASALPHSLPRDGWTLRVIHTNDMHARFEQTSALSSKCMPSDARAGKCFGGFARISTLVKETRASSMPSLFLNAGDTYQGTVWYSVHRWRIVAALLNFLKPDAISLGNHEFDDGPAGLAPFLNATTFPVVTANLDLTKEPALASTNLQKSVILNVAGRKVGIIGYLTPETRMIAVPGEVQFLDEVEAVSKEVKRLQADGVNILIAVGHSGFATDKKIAAEVEGLDLVIGGHTNTFLYTGKQPSLEAPEGLYPTEVRQPSGRRVYVVQAYAYTKYLGNLTVDFDGAGEVRHIEGNPILVDSSIPEDPVMLAELDKWWPAVVNLTTTVVGTTRVLLDGDSKHCRRAECNLGNFITDAIIDYNARQYGGKNGWTDAAVAMFNSRSIQASIEKSEGGKITMGDVLSVLPFSNIIMRVQLNGSDILEVLEHNVRNLVVNETSDLDEGILQFSGLQVLYNLSQPSGSRVVPGSVHLRCASCRVPELLPLQRNQTYEVLVPIFLRGGGDGFAMMPKFKWCSLGVTADEMVVDYISRRSPVYPGVEWRIRFTHNQEELKRHTVASDSNDALRLCGSIIAIYSCLLLSYLLPDSAENKRQCMVFSAVIDILMLNLLIIIINIFYHRP